jgi:transposase-like protein
MKRDIKTKSRRRTPWTEDKNPTPLQSFIDRCTERDYAHRHPTFEEMDESEFINSYELKTCRMCGSDKIVKDGKSSGGIARFKCNACGRRFTAITNTIFDSHKIPISEWIGFLLDIFGYGSFGLTSKVNRNSNNTTMYWMDKTFLLLEGIQDEVVLKDRIWIDETFCKVRSDDIEHHDDGTEYRGLSRNQLCIGVARDSHGQSMFVFEGTGKTSGKKTLDAFSSHIAPGSTLVHDKEKSHRKLVEKLNLKSEVYDSREIKKLPDDDNPLDPINDLCRLLQLFLRAHSGFMRFELQGYLNMFSVIMNKPENKHEKVEKLLSRAMDFPVLLRYRR